MNQPSPLIRARDLARTFAGPPPVHALKHASFDINAGQMVALVGRSGSGKSTLLNLLGLLDSPTAGSLAFSGRETSHITPKERDQLRRDLLGFVFQTFNLVPELSVEANISLALRYCGTPRLQRPPLVAQVIDRVGLEHRASARVSTLSGGEQQRVAIARALVKNPPLVLADEPTGNLDTSNENIVMELLREATSSGAAILIVTHSLDVAAAADRTLHVSDGVVTEGEP